MSTRPVRSLVVVVVLMATAPVAPAAAGTVTTPGSVPTAAGATSVAPQRDGACPTANGVTVVIDFRELGGGVHVRCATGSVSSGLDALQRAGIDHRTTIRFPGFVCRIADRPANDPCVDASPATAYWSYWVAPRGGHWCYSNRGAGSRRPPQGSVEGWSFSLNRTASTAPPPGIAPPAAVPGTPSALSATDCDQRPSASAPAPAPSAPPNQPTPHGPTAPSSRPAPPAPPADRSPASEPAPAAPSDGAPTAGGAGAPPALTGSGATTTTEGSGQGAPGSNVAADDPTGDQPEEEPHDRGEPAAEVLDTAEDGGDEPSSPRASTARHDRELAATDLGGTDRSGSPVPTIVAVVVIAALGGATWWRRRRVGTD